MLLVRSQEISNSCLLHFLRVIAVDFFPIFLIKFYVHAVMQNSHPESNAFHATL